MLNALPRPSAWFTRTMQMQTHMRMQGFTRVNYSNANENANASVEAWNEKLFIFLSLCLRLRLRLLPLRVTWANKNAIGNSRRRTQVPSVYAITAQFEKR